MLKLEDYKTVFAAVGLAGVLLFASPTLSLELHFPSGEKFSELWILGPGHMAQDYPFNVRANVEYSVYVGVSNNMGSSAYYVVYVKFRNQTEPLPNATAGTPSPLQPLYEYRIFVQDGKNWEALLTFTLSRVSFLENQSLVGGLTINDVAFSADTLALWDAENEGHFTQIFLELWIYSSDSNEFQFHNRFVGIWLNVTKSL
jgi:hypothetical protein